MSAPVTLAKGMWPCVTPSNPALEKNWDSAVRGGDSGQTDGQRPTVPPPVHLRYTQTSGLRTVFIFLSLNDAFCTEEMPFPCVTFALSHFPGTPGSGWQARK